MAQMAQNLLGNRAINWRNNGRKRLYGGMKIMKMMDQVAPPRPPVKLFALFCDSARRSMLSRKVLGPAVMNGNCRGRLGSVEEVGLESWAINVVDNISIDIICKTLFISPDTLVGVCRP